MNAATAAAQLEHRSTTLRPVAWSTLPALNSPTNTASLTRPSSVTLPHRSQVTVEVVMPAALISGSRLE
jgi:hypothetical protein